MAHAQRGGSRRKTQWGGFASAAGAATSPVITSVPAGTAVILSTGIIVSGGVGFVDEEVTITRMIGHMLGSMDSTSALTTGDLIIGCLVARVEAIAAGVGSLADPETQPDAEWLYWSSMTLRNGNNALVDGPMSSYSRDFDVRGQRIVRSGSSTVFIAKAPVSTVNAAVNGRFLVKLT